MSSALSATLLFSLVALTGCLGDEDDGECCDACICGGSISRIEASPSILDFDAIPVGEVTSATVIIESTGESVLRLNSIELEEHDEDDLDELEPGGSWPTATELEPGEVLTLRVKWSPRNTTRDTGTIRISTNDSTSRLFEVPIVTPPTTPDASSR